VFLTFDFLTKKGRRQAAEGFYERVSALLEQSAFWQPRGSKGFKPSVSFAHWLPFRIRLNLIRERNIKAFCPLLSAFP
jgi:hypothetical protein